MKSHIALLMVGLFISISSFNQSKFIKPEDFFGFAPGSDRNHFNYEKLIEYLKIADAFSDHMEMRQVGYSPMGKPMYVGSAQSAPLTVWDLCNTTDPF